MSSGKVCAGYTGDALTLLEKGGEPWKEFIGCNAQSTRGHVQPCTVWELALLTQLLTVCFPCPSVELYFTETVTKGKLVPLVLSLFAQQNDRDFSFPFYKRGVFSALFLFSLIRPVNETLTLLMSVSEVHGSKEKLEAEMLLHRKKGVCSSKGSHCS